ncbi:MAG: transporter substrate-binding domain-containing protein [Olsenella sp.]|nr:transporter substrate-binding domain-containing protein [Olsenella sp.]
MHNESFDSLAKEKTPAGVSRRSFVKLSGAGALGIVGASLLGACGPAAQGTSSTSTGSSSGPNASSGTLGDGKTLRVGMEAAYAPYNWQVSAASDYTIPIQNVSGQYADGYDVQFAKVIASALGMEPVAVKMSFSGLIDSLNNGQIDIILAGMTATDERRQAIDFSDPYFVGRFGLLVKSNSPYVGATSLADFTGAAVLGQKDTLLDTVIDEIPDVKHLTPVDSVPSQLSQLAQGTCDAITYNTENTNGFLRSNPDLVAIQFPEGKGFSQTIPVNAGIAKGQDAVLKKINEAIATVPEEERTKMFDAAVERQPA